jgi:hypothetical protein
MKNQKGLSYGNKPNNPFELNVEPKRVIIWGQPNNPFELNVEAKRVIIWGQPNNPFELNVEPKRVILWGQPNNPFGTVFFCKSVASTMENSDHNGLPMWKG